MAASPSPAAAPVREVAALALQHVHGDCRAAVAGRDAQQLRVCEQDGLGHPVGARRKPPVASLVRRPGAGRIDGPVLSDTANEWRMSWMRGPGRLPRRRWPG